MLQETSEKLDKKDFKGVFSRMDKLEKSLSALDLEL